MSASWSRARSLGIRFVAALVVVFLLFGPYFARTMDGWNRYAIAWSTRDTVVLLSGVVLIALVCVLTDELLRGLGWLRLRRLFHHLFVLGLGSGLLANLWFHTARPVGYRIGQCGMEMQTAWLLLVALVGYSLARPDSRLVLRCRQLCMILSPAVPIIVVNLFIRPTYPSPHHPLPRPVAARLVPAAGVQDRARPVYFFVFDEWSYERSFADGSPRPMLPNFAALAQRSIVFHDAHAPGDSTATSLPRLLFETDDEPMVEDGRLGFRHEGTLVAARDYQSIFRRGSERGYQSIFVGFGAPHGRWLAGQVDLCRRYPLYSRDLGDRALAGMGLHTFNAISYWTDPWFRFAYTKLKSRLAGAGQMRVYREMKRDVLEIVTSQPRNTFAIFHYPLPHAPFLLNEDGTRHGLDEQLWFEHTVENYETNLVCVDRLVGDFAAAMKRAGRFGDAMVIVTSDHTWRYDPGRETGEITCPKTHVPLMVKLPRQREAISVASRFETRRLGALIDFALRSEGGTAGVEQILDVAEADETAPNPRPAASAGAGQNHPVGRISQRNRVKALTAFDDAQAGPLMGR